MLLVTLDEENAFNSARWDDIIDALGNRLRTTSYKLWMIGSYLRDRNLI